MKKIALFLLLSSFFGCTQYNFKIIECDRKQAADEFVRVYWLAPQPKSENENNCLRAFQEAYNNTYNQKR